MLLAGWISAKENCTVIGLCSRERGEGVTTVTRGLGHEFNLEFGGPSLSIHASSGPVPKGPSGPKGRVVSDADISPDGALPNDALHPGGGDKPDSLWLLGGLKTLGARGDKIAAMVTRLRRSYRFIAVDIGAFDEASCPFWRGNVDKLLLVVDVASTRREVLEHFRKELDRSVVRFDGFVANRRVHHIPRFLYRMIS